MIGQRLVHIKLNKYDMGFKVIYLAPSFCDFVICCDFFVIFRNEEKNTNMVCNQTFSRVVICDFFFYLIWKKIIINKYSVVFNTPYNIFISIISKELLEKSQITNHKGVIYSIIKTLCDFVISTRSITLYTTQKPLINLGTFNKLEETMKQNNKYPENRKPNENSTTQKLLKKFKPEELEAIWVTHNGMYKTSEFLTRSLEFYVSPYVIRYISNKFNFIREIDLETSPFYKGVLLGKVPRAYYKHVKLNKELKDELSN
jgi:hypothetical protein